MLHEAGDLPAFPPSAAFELVKRACELPDNTGRTVQLPTMAEAYRVAALNGLNRVS